MEKKISTPIGVAAGFDKNAEVYNPLYRLGFGFVEVGTITPEPQYGNQKPRVFRLEEDQALINRLGFNNLGSDNIFNRIKQKKPNGFFGINIGPNKDTVNRIEDYLICFKKFYNLGDYITINISSPNTENLRNFHNKTELEELLESIQTFFTFEYEDRYMELLRIKDFQDYQKKLGYTPWNNKDFYNYCKYHQKCHLFQYLNQFENLYY